MIPAYLYYPLYLLFVLFYTHQLVLRYTNSVVMDTERTAISKPIVARNLCVIIILFIGLRPINKQYFVDMADTAESYKLIQDGLWIPVDNFNFIYDPLLYLFATLGIPVDFFFLFISSIYFGCILLACKKIFPHDTLLTFIAYLGAFSTFGYATNGIKAGAAASLFLGAIAFRDKKKIAILFLVLSLGFHHSMVAPIAAYVLAYFVKRRKWFLYGWLASLLMAALHITYFMTFFASQTDEHGSGYLEGGVDDKIASVSGFRPDFILYSAIPIFVGYFLVKKYKIKSDFYDFIWSVYTITNSVFLLCTYGTFINRIAYLSWLLYPIVLLYPFLNIVWSKRQDVYLKYTIWGHLAFTIFMYVVYQLR